MIGTFMAIKRVFYWLCGHIRYDFEPLHEWLRPGAIRAFPFCRRLRGRQDFAVSFTHTLQLYAQFRCESCLPRTLAKFAQAA
jgi:hypothetical protein